MDEINHEKATYTTVKFLTEKYCLSRTTVIKWAKEDPQVRYFQEGKFLRIHRQDFEDMIERKVNASMDNNLESGD